MHRFFHFEANNLTFESCCEAEGKLWFFANEFNALCNMDVNNYEVNYISSIPSEDIFTKYLCASIQYFQGKLFLIPRAAKCISVFDIKKNEFEEIEISVPVQYDANLYVDWLKFISSIIADDWLYMIPRSYPAIIEMNLHTYELVYHIQWLFDIKNKIMEYDSFFWSDCIIRDEELILASSIANIILAFNIETKRYKVLYSGNIPQSYSGMSMIGKNILLTERKSGRLKLWDMSQNIMTDYGIMPDAFSIKKVIGFSSLIQIGNSIFAIPLWANMMLRVIPGNTEIQTVKNYDAERGNNEEIAISCAWTKNRKLYCMNNLSKSIEVFDENGNTVEYIHMTIADNFCKQMEEKILHNKEALFGESEIFPIKAYLKYISIWNLSDKYGIKHLIGEKILKSQT